MDTLGSIVRRLLLCNPRPPLQPPSSGFQIVDNATRIEEETFSWYNEKDFYPVKIGEIFNMKYQVIGKLGYGGYSTIWLCRDISWAPARVPFLLKFSTLGQRKHPYVTLKVCTSSAPAVKREVEIFNHLNSLTTANVGGSFIRTMLDQFEVTNADGTYQCIVHKPMATDFGTFRRQFPNEKLPPIPLKVALQHLLHALDFLHTEAKVIHADIQEKNILIKLDGDFPLEEFEKEEQTNPSARKIIDDERTIYVSRALKPRKYGRPVLCDFGEARFMQSTDATNIQPYQYRAPEVILDIPWDEKVDIWNVGVMIWDVFEDKNMFKVRGGQAKERSSLYHLSHMVALLGPPPKDFLARSTDDTPWEYFDEEGNWIGDAEIPKMSLEESEENLEGEEKARFLRFMRKMLKWKPEERCSAKELLQDPWLIDGFKLLK